MTLYWLKFTFYDIIGKEAKAGCLNLTYNLLNRNLNTTRIRGWAVIKL